MAGGLESRIGSIQPVGGIGRVGAEPVIGYVGRPVEQAAGFQGRYIGVEHPGQLPAEPATRGREPSGVVLPVMQAASGDKPVEGQPQAGSEAPRTPAPEAAAVERPERTAQATPVIVPEAAGPVQEPEVEVAPEPELSIEEIVAAAVAEAPLEMPRGLLASRIRFKHKLPLSAVREALGLDAPTPVTEPIVESPPDPEPPVETGPSASPVEEPPAAAAEAVEPVEPAVVEADLPFEPRRDNPEAAAVEEPVVQQPERPRRSAPPRRTPQRQLEAVEIDPAQLSALADAVAGIDRTEVLTRRQQGQILETLAHLKAVAGRDTDVTLDEVVSIAVTTLVRTGKTMEEIAEHPDRLLQGIADLTTSGSAALWVTEQERLFPTAAGRKLGQTRENVWGRYNRSREVLVAAIEGKVRAKSGGPTKPENILLYGRVEELIASGVTSRADLVKALGADSAKQIDQALEQRRRRMGGESPQAQRNALAAERRGAIHDAILSGRVYSPEELAAEYGNVTIAAIQLDRRIVIDGIIANMLNLPPETARAEYTRLRLLLEQGGTEKEKVKDNPSRTALRTIVERLRDILGSS